MHTLYRSIRVADLSRGWAPTWRTWRHCRLFSRHSLLNTESSDKSPKQSWAFGDGISSVETLWKEEGDIPRKTFDMSSTAPRDVYQLLTSAIVPRPIALVSTVSPEGEFNLAPFSYFSMVSHRPPVISISFSLPLKRPKDTLQNILSTKQFTTNIISEPFLEAANVTSVEAPAEIDEWRLSGLTMAPSIDISPPCVKESAISLECELYLSPQNISLPDSSEVTTTLILGLIKRVHVRKSVLGADGNSIDITKLRPVARLGGTSYARVGVLCDLPRPTWKSAKETYRTLTSTGR